MCLDIRLKLKNCFEPAQKFLELFFMEKSFFLIKLFVSRLSIFLKQTPYFQFDKNVLEFNFITYAHT